MATWLSLKPQATRNYEDEETTSFLQTRLSEHPASFYNDDCNAVFLPKRLIDVGGSRLRLIEKDSITSKADLQYCALSYCWGPPEHGKFQIKTDNDNIGDHYAGLNFDKLPQVVKDAVKTTRRLSIPYLWVDALCILQGDKPDDKRDWEDQCIQMNDIYGNARVTLIAASSRTCIEGFLNPEGKGLRFPYQSVSRPHITGSFMMYFTHAFGEVKLAYRASESTKHKHPDLFIDLHNDLHFSQWARRGWTFQEHAMAKAHIVFGSTGVYFSQGDKYVSKDGQAGPVAQTSATSVHSNDELHRLWETVIMFRYSAAKTSSFTKKKDLLPALSGLARQFGKKMQFTNTLPVNYIAGHWVDRLYFTLLWEDDAITAVPSLQDIVNLHGQEPYVVPTWSYLMRNRGGLKFADAQHDTEFWIQSDHPKLRSEINILDVYMPLVGTDRYGAIAGAALTLEGHALHLASLSWSEEGHRLIASVTDCGEIWFEEHENERDRLYSIQFTHSRPTQEPEWTGVHFNDDVLDSAKPDDPTSDDDLDSDDNPDLDDDRVLACFGDRILTRRDDGVRRCFPPGRSEPAPLHVYQEQYHGPGPYSYRVGLDFQFEPGASSEPGKMRASFEKLLPRVTLLLVASEEKYMGDMSMDTNGYGLLLLRLEGASRNSFVRVGTFHPRAWGGGSLPYLKQLMKKETIKLF